MNSIKKSIKSLFIFYKCIGATVKWFLYAIKEGNFHNFIVKEIHEKPLCVLVNGPSLKEDIGDVIVKDYDFCVVNDFYKSPYYKEIRPRYHVLADPLYFAKYSEIEPILQIADWNLNLFVPYYAYKKYSFLRKIENKCIHVVPYHSTVYDGFKRIELFLYKKGVSMPRPQNVLVPAIFNGINAGYRDVMIYGADHSWTESIRVDDQNRVCLTDSHFYDTSKVNLLPWNKWTGEPYKMHEVLRDLANMFDSYHRIKRYADYMECHIVNKTKGSYIDAFDRN